jgi:NodT family efflux transporter outer membrane factor (OMF) lipoprotein
MTRLPKPVLMLALLAGCTVGPDYRPAPLDALKVPARFNAARPAPAGSEVDLARWWTAFGDPVLTTLVDRGLAANFDIAQAGARIRQARASLRGVRGAQLPSLGVGGSVSRTIGNEGRSFVDPSGNIVGAGGDRASYQAGFDAAYEADLFGGLRRSVEAARADSDAAEVDLRSAQISIASEIALNYLDARSAQQRLALARASLEALDETVEIVGFRVQAGLVGALDLEQARQLRAQTAASLPVLEQAYTQAANRLSVLLAEPPGAVTAWLGPTRDVPLAPAATAIPADVVRRRPDIASAERQVAAETARVGVRTADLYPALRLAGSFDGSGTSIADVVNTAFGNIVASISAPLFQGGRLRAAVEGQRAAADAALASYRQTVLLALEEVENALTGLSTAERREREQLIAEEAGRAAAILARSQYRAGLIDFQALLESERALLSSQENRLVARADRATAIVQLYKALGGGWENAPPPASAALATTRP